MCDASPTNVPSFLLRETETCTLRVLQIFNTMLMEKKKIFFWGEILLQEIRQQSCELPCRVAKLPENKNRNRYRDVSPCKSLFRYLSGRAGVYHSVMLLLAVQHSRLNGIYHIINRSINRILIGLFTRPTLGHPET